MPNRFHTREELKSHFGTNRMKAIIPGWPSMLENLREYWKMGEDTELITPFCDWFDPKKKWTV